MSDRHEWTITFTVAAGYDENDAVELYERVEQSPSVSGAALSATFSVGKEPDTVEAAEGSPQGVGVPVGTLPPLQAQGTEPDTARLVEERDYLLERQAFAVWGYWEEHGDTEDVAKVAAALLLRPSTAKKAIALAHELRAAGFSGPQEPQEKDAGDV